MQLLSWWHARAPGFPCWWSYCCDVAQESKAPGIPCVSEGHLYSDFRQLSMSVCMPCREGIGQGESSVSGIAKVHDWSKGHWGLSLTHHFPTVGSLPWLHANPRWAAVLSHSSLFHATFSYSVGCLFPLFILSFVAQMFIILMYSPVYLYLSVVSYSINHCQIKCHRASCLCFMLRILQF